MNISFIIGYTTYQEEGQITLTIAGRTSNRYIPMLDFNFNKPDRLKRETKPNARYNTENLESEIVSSLSQI